MLCPLPPCSAAAAGPQAHPHQGVVPPFSAGNPNVKLDKHALGILGQGHAYSTQIESASGGRGLVVQDIKAPTSIVWDRILDYNNYHTMVPKTIESQNYKVENHKNGTQTIYTRMKVGFPMLQLLFFIKHSYQPKLNSLTWTLDYSQKSDFDDSCGYWYVIPHPENPQEWTRVYYSVQVSMFDWVPTFVVNFMSKQALTEATGWVKKFSELEYAKNKKQGSQERNVVVTPTTTRRPWWKLITTKPRRRNKHDNEEEKTCASTNGDCGVDLEKEMVKPLHVGVQRYALVTAVILLTFYNIHLFFSQ